MSYDDDTTPRYLGGFRAAVRRLLGPHPGWSAVYTDDAAYAQAVARAYQAGRLDGMAEALALPAPGPVADDDEPTRAPFVVEPFDTPAEPPQRLTLTLPPMGGTNPRTWAVRHARAVLGLSLAEGTDYVRELLDV
ncbi:MAG TPA: hypothetical protein VLS51_06660 [Propionibacteriaceae bacterium]|nr:hypothetical protein [Propionibacteriaceae bacterium]